MVELTIATGVTVGMLDRDDVGVGDGVRVAGVLVPAGERQATVKITINTSKMIRLCKGNLQNLFPPKTLRLSGRHKLRVGPIDALSLHNPLDFLPTLCNKM